jgi:peptide/nickel transport system substrate-binding protein
VTGPGSRTRVVAAALAMTVASACLRRPTPNPNVLVVGITSGPNNLDPRFGLDDVSQKLHQLIFDSLLVFDDRMQLAPGLAERFENPTPTTYIARLRRGVHFHDGHELTAADVVFTFRSLIDPALGSLRQGGYRELAAVDAIDRYTVVFTLKTPYTSFPINLNAIQIVPEGASADLRDHPVGTGPYRYVSYAVDDHLELTKFDGYWQGAPKNDGLILKVVPDEVMRALEVRKGTMDIVVNDVSPDILYQLNRDPAIQTRTGAGVDCQYLGINFHDPALRDLRVRQAVAFGINRPAIVEHLRRGLAAPAVGLLPPNSWAFEPDVPTYDYDPAKSRALLDAAGYPDPDGDGPSPRLRLSLKVSNVEFNRLQSAVIQEDLRKVGIAIDVRSYEFATLFADVVSGNFQLYTLQWTGGALADPDILRRVFHTAQVPPAGFNRGHYSNPVLDDLLDRATSSQDDQERRRLYSRAQQVIAADLPYINIWYKTNFAIAQRNLSGIRLNPFGDYVFLKDVARASTAAAN